MARPTSWHDFVPLPENISAYRAVHSMVKKVINDSKTGTPFIFIHGETGCGKSHLVSLTQRDAGSRVLIVPARDFTRPSDIVDVISVPLLIIEDIQYVPTEHSERIVSVIDARRTRKQMMIITSNKPPADLSDLPRRLTSRFASGLVIRIANLSPASKTKLIPFLANQTGTPITNENYAYVSEEIQNPGNSIRTLKAALKQKPSQQNNLLSEIVKRVAKVMNIAVSSVFEKTRVKNLVIARQIVALVAIKDCGIKHKTVQKFFTSIGLSSSFSSLEWKMMKDERLKLLVENFRKDWQLNAEELVAQILRDDLTLSLKSKERE